MIGQHFDSVWVYLKDITNKFDNDNRLNYGVSKDIVAQAIRDLGVKIYQNNFSTNDLFSALLGITTTGDLYNLPYTTGSLPTPSGKIIEALISRKCKPGISSRALGSLQRENNVNVVQDDLQIICWDFVSEPSTPGAFMMAEAKQYDMNVVKNIFTKSDLVDRAANEILSLKKK